MVSIAICDDVYNDAETLKSYLCEILPDADMTIFSNGDQLLRTLENSNDLYQAIFLDIHMPGKNGIQIADEIRRTDISVPIVFVSRSDGYYKEAFEVFAYQYLLKPVSYEAVVRIVRPLQRIWGRGEERVLYYRYRSQLNTIKLNQISYISSSLHTVHFHMTDGRSNHCRGKLNDFGKQLENSNFLRCHQSFFVNMDEVEAMKSDSFIMEDTVIPISRSFAKETKQKYKEYLEKQGRK